MRKQIDDILFERRWRTELVNVKTRPIADCGSNHQLLRTTVRVSLKSKKKQSRPPKYNRTRIPEQFTDEVQNSFTPLLDQDEDWRPAAEQHIPKQRKVKQPWIRDETLEIAVKKKAAKASGNHDEWRHLDKESAKHAPVDKWVYLESNCEQMEEEHHHHNSKPMFRLVKAIAVIWSLRSDIINDKNRYTLTEEEALKAQWMEYCSELYRGEKEMALQYLCMKRRSNRHL